MKVTHVWVISKKRGQDTSTLRIEVDKAAHIIIMIKGTPRMGHMTVKLTDFQAAVSQCLDTRSNPPLQSDVACALRRTNNKNRK